MNIPVEELLRIIGALYVENIMLRQQLVEALKTARDAVAAREDAPRDTAA